MKNVGGASPSSVTATETTRSPSDWAGVTRFLCRSEARECRNAVLAASVMMRLLLADGDVVGPKPVPGPVLHVVADGGNVVHLEHDGHRPLDHDFLLQIGVQRVALGRVRFEQRG